MLREWHTVNHAGLSPQETHCHQYLGIAPAAPRAGVHRRIRRNAFWGYLDRALVVEPLGVILFGSPDTLAISGKFQRSARACRPGGSSSRGRSREQGPVTGVAIYEVRDDRVSRVWFLD